MSVDYSVTDVFAEKGKLVLTDGKLSTKYEKGGHVDTMLNAPPSAFAKTVCQLGQSITKFYR